MGRLGFGDYLKAAFTNRWHLLALGGAVVAAIIAPFTDVCLALVAAGELLFLTAVATNPRFQRSTDANFGAQDEARSAESMNRRFTQLFSALDAKAREQFDSLRQRCEPLRTSGAGEAGFDSISEAHLQGVNRLLWVYLKLLYTRCTLARFFKSVDEDEMKKLRADLHRRLEVLPPSAADELTEKKRRSLQDTLATADTRLDNLKRARDNSEYVELELERIATKLTALAELAVNRQDPASITSEVDDVARSVETTEKAISDLQIFTGLAPEEITQAPPIIQPLRQQTRG